MAPQPGEGRRGAPGGIARHNFEEVDRDGGDDAARLQQVLLRQSQGLRTGR